MDASSVKFEQNQIANFIASRFGIDSDRVFFINDRNPLEPWIPPDQLIVCARKDGRFRAIEERYDQFIGPRKQVVHEAMVIDQEGRSYKRSGVATIGERKDFDEHTLAAGRALSAALTAAGFNPVKQKPFKPVATYAEGEPQGVPIDDDVEQRNKDLARIHILAKQAGYITDDAAPADTKYRKYLREHYKVGSALLLDQTGRASLINALQQIVIEQSV